jgi:hypothetical protein
MQTSLQNQLLTLSLKMDTSLQAIDQLSQLLILLIAELQGTGTAQTLQGQSLPEPQRSTPPLPKSPLLEALLDQLSMIRQDLQRSTQPLTDLLVPVPLLLEDLMPQGLPEEHLVSDRSLGDLHHKDVLEDDDSFGLERTTNSAVPAEMQVRRLMAQLTAAYNRIAALEEQLLSSHRTSYASQDAQA